LLKARPCVLPGIASTVRGREEEQGAIPCDRQQSKPGCSAETEQLVEVITVNDLLHRIEIDRC